MDAKYHLKNKKNKEEGKRNEKLWSWFRRGILVCRLAIHTRLRQSRMVEGHSRYRGLAVLPWGFRSGPRFRGVDASIAVENYCPRLSDLIR